MAAGSRGYALSGRGAAALERLLADNARAWHSGDFGWKTGRQLHRSCPSPAVSVDRLVVMR